MRVADWLKRPSEREFGWIFLDPPYAGGELERALRLLAGADLLAEGGLRLPFVVYAVALLVAAAIVALRLSHASLAPPQGSTPAPPMRLAEAVRDSA